MLITDEEKKEIDEIDKKYNMKSYDGVLRYGSKTAKDNKKYNYICPRFWCIKDPKGEGMSNKPLSLKQVDKGVCGGWDAVIKDDKSEVPEGKFIYEFSDKRMHRKDQDIPHYDEKDGDVKKLAYKQMYPSFLGSKQTVPGLCTPCCFKSPPKGININENNKYNFKPESWKKLLEKKKEWLNEDGSLNFNVLEKMDDSLLKEKIIEGKNLPHKGSKSRFKGHCKHTPNDEEVIEGEEREIEQEEEVEKRKTIPSDSKILNNNELGNIDPMTLDFLNFDRNTCFKYEKGKDDKRLKENIWCLFRLGVPMNSNQSFLSMMSSVYEFYDKKSLNDGTATKKLNDFKNDFIKNLTLDKFMIAQNGILPKLFERKIEDIDIEKYNNKKLLIKLKNKYVQQKIVNAFENFKNFFMDKNEKIDYTYIWDLLCKPINEGGVLFKEGINLIIIKEISDDILASKIEIVCPMNYYSSEFFDDSKKTLIVINNNETNFEPLCSVKLRKDDKKKGKWEVKKFFSKKDTINNFPKLYSVIMKIKENLNKYCNAKPSVKKSLYDYVSNISFDELRQKLDKKEIDQIFNSNNKVIGGLVTDGNKHIYIPTKPSTINPNINSTYIDNIRRNYLDYEETRDLLRKYSKLDIPCEPKSKIIDDNVIVGIKTITNQMVPVKPNISLIINDDLVEENSYSGNNELEIDENIMKTNEADTERKRIVKSIKLENSFYSMFRNTLKIILSDDESKIKKRELVNIINNNEKGYFEKFENASDKLKEILSGAIDFVEINLEILDDYDDLLMCFGLDKQSCENTNGCSFMRENTCVLTLPKTNLFNNEDNTKLYFNKLADELIRFSKIRNYIFTKREFLSFNYVSYKINNNEIILLEDVLLNSYFNKKLISKNKSKYIKSENIYELVKSENSIDFVNKTYDISEDKMSEEKEVEEKEVEEKEVEEKEVEIEVKENTDNDNCILNNVDNKIKKDLKDILLKNNEIKMERFNTKNKTCGFVLVRNILNKLKGKKIKIEQIKKDLIEEQIKLNMPEHKIGLIKGYSDMKKTSAKTENITKNWEIFSLINAFKNKSDKTLVKNIESKLTKEEKNKEVSKIIKGEDYSITGFDLFLIFKRYDIPALILNQTKQGSILNTSIKGFNTKKNSKKYVIIHIKRNKLSGTNKELDLLVNSKDSTNYILSNNIDKKRMESLETDVEEYLNESIKKIEETREKYKNKDKQIKNAKKPKKINKKMRLPSE